MYLYMSLYICSTPRRTLKFGISQIWHGKHQFSRHVVKVLAPNLYRGLQSEVRVSTKKKTNFDFASSSNLASNLCVKSFWLRKPTFPVIFRGHPIWSSVFLFDEELHGKVMRLQNWSSLKLTCTVLKMPQSCTKTTCLQSAQLDSSYRWLLLYFVTVESYMPCTRQTIDWVNCVTAFLRQRLNYFDVYSTLIPYNLCSSCWKPRLPKLSKARRKRVYNLKNIIPKRRVTVLVANLIVSFVICWLPFHSWSTVDRLSAYFQQSFTKKWLWPNLINQVLST